MPRPAFLSLDGLDGTGKSTQCRLMVEWLTAQAVPVTACTDPGGTALGQELRNLLLFGREHRIATTTEAMLFMASRAQLVEEVIRPALGRGEVVVSDSFEWDTGPMRSENPKRRTMLLAIEVAEEMSEEAPSVTLSSAPFAVFLPSKITKANRDRSSWISVRIRSEASSSEGFGGVGPARMMERFGTTVSWITSSIGVLAAR